jgi:hypothetical protein
MLTRKISSQYVVVEHSAPYPKGKKLVKGMARAVRCEKSRLGADDPHDAIALDLKGNALARNIRFGGTAETIEFQKPHQTCEIPRLIFGRRFRWRLAA